MTRAAAAFLLAAVACGGGLSSSEGSPRTSARGPTSGFEVVAACASSDDACVRAKEIASVRILIPGCLAGPESESRVRNDGALRVTFHRGSPDVCAVTVLDAAPAFSVPEHTHATSTEHLYIAQGSGRMMIDGVEALVAAPAEFMIPPGVRHSFVSDGHTNLVAVQVYAPPGPEARFRAFPLVTPATPAD